MTDSLFLDFQTAVAGRYSLERELGRGGMGIVYLAREVRLERPVAIKLLPPQLADRPDLRARFLSEARIAAQLFHPNIVPIHAVDEVGEFVFFTMAYVPGETLAARVRRSGPVPPVEAARMLRDVGLGLAYAHGQGVIHRDVKPENIILEEKSGRPMIADFGIARSLGQVGMTTTGDLLGTPAYMSPEQAGGEVLDARSDLYSLGAVGFFMLSGRLPFEARDPVSMAAQRLVNAAPPIANLAPGTPARLAQAIDRCLLKDREDRFSSGAEFADAAGLVVEQVGHVSPEIRTFIAQGDTRSGVSLFAFFLLVGDFAIFGLALAQFWTQPKWLEILSRSIFPLAAVLALTVTLLRVRDLLKSGESRADLVAAFGRQRKPDAAAVRHDKPVARLASLARKIWLGGVAVFAAANLPVALGADLDRIPGIDAGSLIAMIVGFGGAVILSGGWSWRAGLRGGDHERFWQGWRGRALFRVATLGLRPAPPRTSNQPTEMGVGLAVESLFEALSRDWRRELEGLPAVVEQLQSHAVAMRKRIADIESLAAQAGQGVAQAEAPQREEVVADLLAARERAQARLAEIITALETLRLGLLRLHGGVGRMDALSGDLAEAKRIAERTDLLEAGAMEVERLLAGEPRTG